MKRQYSAYRHRKEKIRKKQLSRRERRIELRRLKSKYFPREDATRAQNSYFLDVLGKANLGDSFTDKDIALALQRATARDEVLNFGYGNQLKWAIEKGYMTRCWTSLGSEKKAGELETACCGWSLEEINGENIRDGSTLISGEGGYCLTVTGKVLSRQSWIENETEKYVQNKKITIDDTLERQRERARPLEGPIQDVLVGMKLGKEYTSVRREL